MTLDDLLAELEARGLRVWPAADGTPTLRGPKEEVTPALLRMLRHHRAEIAREFGLGVRPVEIPTEYVPREWRWAGGHLYREEESDAWIWMQEGRHPTGALWWRRQGESEWLRVPGRGDLAGPLIPGVGTVKAEQKGIYGTGR